MVICLTTPSFLGSTPGWKPSLGFPELSVVPSGYACSSLQQRGPFPIQYTFVVQFAAATARGDAGLAGRVEHIVSGQARRFQSVEELLAFVTQILQTVAAPADL